MASSVPSALDYLVAQIRTLPAATAAKVSDGWPAERGDELVAVGINPEEEDSSATVAYSQLDGMDVEFVEIPSFIGVRRSGDGALSAARAQAFVIYDAIREMIRQDRTLGGAVRPGLPARISQYTMAQTDQPQQAGEGRWCEIRWTLSWQHRG